MEQMESAIKKGKKNLETLLRDKAINDVSEELIEQGIDPNELSDDDFEVLVSEKASSLESNLKSVGVGSAIGFAVSLFIGV